MQADNGAGLRRGSAASGLLLVLFLLLHLAGVALAPLAPQRFEAYAAGLHRSAWLPAAELALLAVALVHLGLSLARALANRRAAGGAALRSRRSGPLAPLAALAARSQVAGGVVLLLFLVVHLAQLRWPRPLAGLSWQRWVPCWPVPGACCSTWRGPGAGPAPVPRRRVGPPQPGAAAAGQCCRHPRLRPPAGGVDRGRFCGRDPGAGAGTARGGA